MLYALLDAARERSDAALREVHGRGGGGTFAARMEREVSAAEQARRLTQLNGVERGLCFGRMDDTDHRTFYIGRIGLHDNEYEPVLIDWRAPAARPFYAATPNDPAGLLRRRHLYTRGRAVVGLDDEVFDLDSMSEADRRGLVGEALLLATIRRGRTGRMSDVVATIQAEQDRVIRSALAGVLVVQGGPGTGKTVAALHRAAYLLYTHRKTLERRGVLIVGPNATFLRYISQVLPSLGETDVVMSSLGELFPGVRATAEDTPEAAVLKGDLRMVRILRAAVRDRQRVPRGDLEVSIDGVPVRVPADVCERARIKARGMRRPHNVARKLFVTEMLDALAAAEAEVLGRSLDTEDMPYVRARLWDEDPVREALDALWPFLTPQQLLAGLFGEEGALRRAAPGLSQAERDMLMRTSRTELPGGAGPVTHGVRASVNGSTAANGSPAANSSPSGNASPAANGSGVHDASPAANGSGVHDGSPAADGSGVHDGSPAADGSGVHDGSPAADGSGVHDGSPAADGSGVHDGSPAADGSGVHDGSPAADGSGVHDGSPAADGSGVHDGSPAADGSGVHDGSPAADGSGVHDGSPSGNGSPAHDGSPAGGGWTVADVPLLDEAAELLGADDTAEKAMRGAAERQRRDEEEYAQGVLELTGLAGQGLVDAATIAGRNRDTGPDLTTAERAAADRSWAYGHVIVDEAQELSQMAWRMLMRRVPTRSLTVVGDIAQTGNAAGARSWGEMLDRYVKGRWREERLTVNYRTPAEIMTVASGVLAAVAPDEHPPESVREEGAVPRVVRAASPGEFGREVATVVDEELAGLTAAEEGRLAVIAPAARLAELAAAIPSAVTGDRAEALDSPVALLTVAQAKGLEFDRVVLADPAGVIAQSPKGGQDLYVAITRATHRLAVVYEGDLPPILALATPAPTPAR